MCAVPPLPPPPRAIYARVELLRESFVHAGCLSRQLRVSYPPVGEIGETRDFFLPLSLSLSPSLSPSSLLVRRPQPSIPARGRFARTFAAKPTRATGNQPAGSGSGTGNNESGTSGFHHRMCFGGETWGEIVKRSQLKGGARVTGHRNRHLARARPPFSPGVLFPFSEGFRSANTLNIKAHTISSRERDGISHQKNGGREIGLLSPLNAL